MNAIAFFFAAWMATHQAQEPEIVQRVVDLDELLALHSVDTARGHGSLGSVTCLETVDEYGTRHMLGCGEPSAAPQRCVATWLLSDPPQPSVMCFPSPGGKQAIRLHGVHK